MARREGKRRPPTNFRIECPDCSHVEGAPPVLIDVEEEGTFSYRGRTITVNINTLIEIRKLGEGHFGNVMLCEVENQPGFQMAVKRLNLLPPTNNPNDYSSRTDLRTIRLVGSGENPYVTTFYTAFVNRSMQQLLICMEVCETSMENFYKTMHTIQEIESLDLLLKRMISHIVDALRFLKSKNILHRDVKPSNILINQNPIIFKLCDFGICGQLVDSVSRTIMIGTEIYLAPERMDPSLSPRGYGIQSDMWGLGLSILEIASNEHPFRGLRAAGIMYKIIDWIPELPPNLSTELQALTLWLLKKEQADRPKLYDDILQSSAVQSLSAEITDGEAKMAKNVIEKIPAFEG